MANLNTFVPNTIPHNFRAMPSFNTQSHVAVIGAGAFGGWSALYLRRKGFQVTLVDTWGPGNSRASSGDETRVIRSTYGDNEFYFNLNVRALKLWKENQLLFGKQIFHNTGVLWLCYQEHTPLVDDSIPFARKHNMEYTYLSNDELRERYPKLNTDDLHHAYFDPYGGYLRAREACQAVKEAFIREGGQFVQAEATPGKIHAGALNNIQLSNGLTVKADAYLFACGAWLPQIFPDVLGDRIICTRQEVYYFGTPSKEASCYENFPVWIDADGEDNYYGIAGNGHRGFKIGVDRRGARFNPATDSRIIDPEVLEHARNFIAHRFPGLKGAPLIENRVCPYESSADGNFIFQTHPEASNILLLGGGSGHGFKHGPALGELVANTLSA